MSATTAAGQVIMGNVEGVYKGSSFITLFLEADLFVQLIMLALLSASIWCWAIVIHKYQEFKKIRKASAQFEELFWSGKSLDKVYDQLGTKPDNPMAHLFMSAMQEWHESVQKNNKEYCHNLVSRINRILQVTMDYELKNMQKYTGFLATTGSAAPFVGLLGTVWGIMNSFQSIASSKNTSLAVVAPGIAEALLATALGLIAAIPAVIAYNRISQSVNQYATKLEIFASELETIIARQIFEDK